MNFKYIHQSFDSSPRDSRLLSNERCQTILNKAVFEHFTEIYDVAALLLVSKSLQNSSFGANFAVNFKIDNEALPLFDTVLSPSSCLSLQFIPSLHIMKVPQHEDDTDAFDDEMTNFVAELIKTKYLHLQLRSLWLDEVTNDVLHTFFEGTVSWPQLQSLNLIDNPTIDGAAMAMISQSAIHVSHLSLRDCLVRSKEIADEVLAHAAQLSGITFLDLYRCDETTDVGLHHVSSLKEIRHLDLSWCEKISDAGLLSISSLSSMTWLSVCWCDSITDTGLEHISTLSAITDLNLAGCKRITDAGLEHVSKLSNLTALDLVALDRITPVGMEHVSSCRSITALNVARCDLAIDDACLEHISKLSHTLNHLDASWCRKISDAGLLHVAKLANLTNLNLYLCDNISDAGLQHLLGISGLRVLNIHGCFQITNEAKEKIRETIPKCLVCG